jgi:cob(I)alamin adenosyltransferase
MADDANSNLIRKNLGLIHLYTGDGKGKTTAAVGLSVRAKAAGLRVLFVQFLKSGNSAELKALETQGVEVISGQPSSKFVFQMDPDEKEITRVFHEKRLIDAFKATEAGVDLLVLDEILGAIATGMVTEVMLLDFLNNKPKHLEVVLTGRDPSENILEVSDYVSEVVMRKHPFESSGLSARKGIEF